VTLRVRDLAHLKPILYPVLREACVSRVVQLVIKQQQCYLADSFTERVSSAGKPHPFHLLQAAR